MQSPLACARMLHGGEQHRMLKEFTILDHQVNAGDVHVNDAPGADIEMPDFAVAHLPLGQPDKKSAGMNQSVGIFAKQAVVVGLARQRNSVGLGLGAITPAVEDDED